MIYVLAFAALLAAYVLWRAVTQRQQRAALLQSTLSDEDRAALRELVPIYSKMPADLQKRLEGKVNLFLDQVDFYGGGGQEVDRDMAISIAGQACVLVAGNDAWFSTLRTVIIYPGAFKSKREEHDGFVVTEGESVRIGESWARGPVILSWADSERGAFIDDDGHNVVFHEFAHQLDNLSGDTNGLPLLGGREEVDAWIAAFNDAYARANRLLEIGKRPFLDPYGATAPEELFAVAVEAFFETPREMKGGEPELYAVLTKYFRQDPARW
ncbi:MAG: M90 family metallopeptidase [Pseudomonadota bacterium]